ncbi:MAG: penicillin-binding protein 2 [Candidatus Spechtbacterales bacterium]
MVNKNNKKRKGKTSTVDTLSLNWRIYTLFLIFTLISAGLLFRLYDLQIVKGKYYTALARGQGVDVETNIPRGEIYFQDNAGEGVYIAAANKELFVAYADPKEVSDERLVLDKVSEAVIVPTEDEIKILERLQNKNSSYALIARNLTEEQSTKLREMKLPGVYTRVELLRYYPAGEVAAHVLGFLGFSGSDRTGQYGVEEYYNPLLAGSAQNNSLLGNLFSFGGENSTDVELTIDYGIQFVVEKKLEEVVNRYDAVSGTAIFMDPKTGAVIAMANFPDYNPNTYNEIEDIHVLHNNAVQSVYELGSVFKPITLAAAMDGVVITPQTTYVDTGKVELSGYTIRNSDLKAHEEQTMTQVMEKSLNTGVVYAQQELGKKKFREYLENFQLHKKTGIDLPGEVEGNIKNIQNTNRDINFATASFGQGISLSPIRFLSSISAIANGGVMMKPYVVKKIVTENGSRDTVPEEAGRPISAMTASRITAMMVSAVDNGYGSKAAVPGYSMAGKTGTAQIPNEGSAGYSSKTLHSFVGFVPAYDPKFIGIIIMNDPKGIRFSSDSVAPTFRDISSFILQYYKVPPK